MQNTVKVVSKKLFNELVLHSGFQPNIAYISILDPEEAGLMNLPSNALQLKFHSIDKEGEIENGVLFSDAMARQIIDFAVQHGDKNFLIHCTMGVERSGAVGDFIRQMLKLDYDLFTKMNPQIVPNNHVAATLREVYLRQLNKAVHPFLYGEW